MAMEQEEQKGYIQYLPQDDLYNSQDTRALPPGHSYLGSIISALYGIIIEELFSSDISALWCHFCVHCMVVLFAHCGTVICVL